MYGTERLNVFRKMLPKESWPDQEEDGIEETIRRTYLKIKKEGNGKGKKTSQTGKLGVVAGTE
jgi:hypothetical protein